MVSLFFSKNVTPEGHSSFKLSIGALECVIFSNQKIQLSFIPAMSCLISSKSLILCIISSFCQSLAQFALILTFSLNTNLKSSLGQNCLYLMKFRWFNELIKLTLNYSNSRSIRSLRCLSAMSSCMWLSLYKLRISSGSIQIFFFGDPYFCYINFIFYNRYTRISFLLRGL